MMLRTVADDNPSLDILEIVRDPTGSPVVMCVFISSASISRLRSSISDLLLTISTFSARAHPNQPCLAQPCLAQPELIQLSNIMFIMPLFGPSRRKVPLRRKSCQGAAPAPALTIENTRKHRHCLEFRLQAVLVRPL